MAYTTIDNPEAYFQTVLYTGDASTQSVTLPGDTDMQPDLVWIKNRDEAQDFAIFDSVRGTQKQIKSNTNEEELTRTDALSAFNTDGFTVGSRLSVNGSADKIVAWCWKANGSGSANTDGSTNTASTSANTTSGISICKYEGNGTQGSTIGHGLGVAPTFVIAKSLSQAQHWAVGHIALPFTKYMTLNSTDALADHHNRWGDTNPSSSVITIGDQDTVNTDGDDYICYAFTPIQGFSKFGSYTGNGNADGTFIYTGFRPAWIMIKKSSGAGNSWEIFDNKRVGYNVDNNNIRADASDSEYTTDRLDILSNGFKCRATTTNVNGSGSTYIYMAFAEAPFVNSNGVPCNAR